MKYFFIILVSFLCFNNSYSQDSDFFKYNNAIKISPIEFGSAEFKMSYEHYFGVRKSSISIIPSVILKDNFDESKSGVQVMGQYRVFLSHLRSDEGKSILGFYNIAFYGGVYSLYLNQNEDYRYGVHNPVTNEYDNLEFHKDITAFEGGALVGMQVDITNRIVLDMYVGGGIRQTDLVDTRDETETQPDYYYYGVFDPEYKGVKPNLGLQIGFTF